MSIGYGIFSGGLDSLLAALVLRDQGVEVCLVTFTTPFFSAEKAVESGRAIGMAPMIVDITDSHLKMMQNPKHGFGRFMNPCIDCHALMFRKTGEIMTREGGDFLFSGEVLGQRPKSQTRSALDIVARESGFADSILRPLSAKRLNPTLPEKEGLVDRSKLLGFSGRSRKPQMELARQYGLKDYPPPAGGCLLTDPIFSRRLSELARFQSPLDAGDVELLKWGRHFRLDGGGKLVVGRNKGENEALERLCRSGDLMLKVSRIPGPTVLLTPKEKSDLDTAAMIVVSYSDAKDGSVCQVQVAGREKQLILEASGRPKKDFAHWMV